jgi:hypothetical protein
LLDPVVSRKIYAEANTLVPVQFAFLNFHLHRGFSPVATWFLLDFGTGFNGLLFHHRAETRETVETVQTLCAALFTGLKPRC